MGYQPTICFPNSAVYTTAGCKNNRSPYKRVMISYESIRQKYRPKNIKVLLIAESPPPAPDVQSSRQFYYTDRVRKDDRLFTNTIRALYPETVDLPEDV